MPLYSTGQKALMFSWSLGENLEVPILTPKQKTVPQTKENGNNKIL